ncbi:N4-gp56 family major capsid protein [Sneathiella glossodoripedis]|uniref:N4-gp56 family major capsid protein n=1 Tax=Sneathiella glossodoripedis TaxID=418853 RepID=UPI000A00A58A|nr:N4-gp56 family major capsid protein [Sneathiella glossodoripedis]
MADTTVATGLTVQQWDSKFFKEYLSQNRFKPFMGTSENSIIQVKDDLTKKNGDSITFALVNKLAGDGVTGSNTLEGNEEDMASRSHKLTVEQIRHAVRVASTDEQFSAIPLRDAAKSVLKDWMMEKTRDDIIAAFGSINGVAYASATETQKDAWLVDNADRVLFGAAKSNNSSNDHSASLANIDSTNDKLTPEAISLMKRMALQANPKIRPIRTTEDERWFVLFANSYCFRDLKENATMTQAQREALARGAKNKLFTGGDLMWDGVIIKEIEDIGVLSGVGASSIDVAPNYFCGAQALGIGWAKRTFTKDKDFDYGDKKGVAVGEFRGIEKLTFGSGDGDTDDLKDHGVLTGFFSAVADA